jgi:hypothetical protein
VEYAFYEVERTYLDKEDDIYQIIYFLLESGSDPSLVLNYVNILGQQNRKGFQEKSQQLHNILMDYMS